MRSLFTLNLIVHVHKQLVQCACRLKHLEIRYLKKSKFFLVLSLFFRLTLLRYLIYALLMFLLFFYLATNLIQHITHLTKVPKIYFFLLLWSRINLHRFYFWFRLCFLGLFFKFFELLLLLFLKLLSLKFNISLSNKFLFFHQTFSLSSRKRTFLQKLLSPN